MSDHEWCRYVRRDEAAVPSIQHRDLPEVVAALTERVAELTTKHNALADLARLDAGWLKANEQRLTAERDEARARVAELEAAEKQAASTEAMRCMTKMRRERDDARAERDAALRERDAAQSQCEELERAALVDHQTIGTLRARVAELERDRRPATWQEEEAAVEGAWLLCGLEPDWPSDEPGTIVRHAESMRREVGRLRDRVAELEATAAANAMVLWMGATPQPRGWLTEEERGALKRAFDLLCDDDGDQPLAGTVQRLLARSSPPMVRRPEYQNHSRARDCQWIAAIRAAGVEVEG